MGGNCVHSFSFWPFFYTESSGGKVRKGEVGVFPDRSFPIGKRKWQERSDWWENSDRLLSSRRTATHHYLVQFGRGG